MPLRLRSAGGGSVQLNSPVALATDVSMEVPGYAGAKLLTDKTPGAVINMTNVRAPVGEVTVASNATTDLISTNYTTSVPSRLFFLFNSAQIKRTYNFQNPRITIYVDNVYVDQVDTDHIGYGWTGSTDARQQVIHTAVSGVLAPGVHTVRVQVGCYSESGSIVFNYQSGSSPNRLAQLFITEVAA